MKKKSVLALAFALALAGTVGTTSITAEAAGLTQAADSTLVNYGTVDAADQTILSSIFDYEFYKESNPDVVAVLGDDYSVLFEHFVKCGVFEGRVCNPNFDPAAYASAYSDLKDVFGTDILKYYEHFVTFGATEQRTLTTVEACVNAGITVQSIVDESVKVTPEIYKIAKAMGTTDFATVKYAVSRAASSGSSSSSSSSTASNNGATIINTSRGSYLVVPEKSDAKAYADASGYEAVATLEVESDNGYGSIMFYLIKGADDKGYAVYESNSEFFNSNLADVTPICQTSDYVAPESWGSAMVSHFSVSIAAKTESESSSSSSSSETYDRTNEEVLKFNSETTTTESGNLIYTTTYIDHYNNVEANVVSERATDYDKMSTEVIGYYTNADGSEYHLFENNDEIADYYKNIAQTVNPESTYTVEDGVMYFTTEDGYWNYENITHESYTAIDVKGDASTSYDVGGSVEVKQDGTVEVTIAVSNDDNQFGYISTIDFTETSEDAE